MNANLKKLEKLQAEYARNDKKMAALMERQQEIENQCTELENLEIVGMVRGLGMSFEELAELINGEDKPKAAPRVAENPLEENPADTAAELNNEVEAAYAVATEDYATENLSDGEVWNG